MRAEIRRHRRLCAACIATVPLALLAVFFVLNYWPSVGAQGADLLRGLLGDEAVARLEMVLFSAQDKVQQIQYDLGMLKPAAPWQNASSPHEAMQVSPSSLSTPTPGQTPIFTQPRQHVSGEKVVQLPVVNPTVTPSSSPTPAAWQPSPATPLGDLAGEGSWTPYIQDARGTVMAYRTFLQPDPQRPYAVVAVVAIDLAHTRLHYVLGSDEPYSPDSPPRSGAIPPADLIAGRLLATFNGGFKATHGHFGAMADGITALPPQDGLGTLAIYKDGACAWANGGQKSPRPPILPPGVKMARWSSTMGKSTHASITNRPRIGAIR